MKFKIPNIRSGNFLKILAAAIVLIGLGGLWLAHRARAQAPAERGAGGGADGGRGESDARRPVQAGDD